MGKSAFCFVEILTVKGFAPLFAAVEMQSGIFQHQYFPPGIFDDGADFRRAVCPDFPAHGVGGKGSVSIDQKTPGKETGVVFSLKLHF